MGSIIFSSSKSVNKNNSYANNSCVLNAKVEKVMPDILFYSEAVEKELNNARTILLDVKSKLKISDFRFRFHPSQILYYPKEATFAIQQYPAMK